MRAFIIPTERDHILACSGAIAFRRHIDLGIWCLPEMPACVRVDVEFPRVLGTILVDPRYAKPYAFRAGILNLSGLGTVAVSNSPANRDSRCTCA